MCNVWRPYNFKDNFTVASKNKEFADVYENRCDLEPGLAGNDASAEGHNMKMMKIYGFSNDLRSKCLKA